MSHRESVDQRRGTGPSDPGLRQCSAGIVVLVALASLLAFLHPRSSRAEDLIGQVTTYLAAEQDTLGAIARRFGFGYVELVAANRGVDPWLPGEGREIVLPGAHLLPEGPREGIVINLAEQRLYYFAGNGAAVRSFPLGVGRSGWNTPTGQTYVAGKRYKPTWYPPASVRAEKPDLPGAVPPGENNPLGSHALDLAWESYVIHGTNRPAGIGRRISYGCIRLYPDDIARLFAVVPVGTGVRIVDQPAKLGWFAGELYLEVHPTQGQADELETSGRFTPRPVPDLMWRVHRAAGDEADRLDWLTVRAAVRERSGVPIRITR